MKHLIGYPNHLTVPKLDFEDIRIHHYPNALVSYLMFNSRGGLRARMAFPQPYSMRKRSATDGLKVREESMRLQEGVLLSFIWIQDSTIHHQFFTVVERSTDTRNDNSLTHHNNTATVTVAVTKQNEQAVEILLDLSCQKNRGILLEFSQLAPRLVGSRSCCGTLKSNICLVTIMATGKVSFDKSIVWSTPRCRNQLPGKVFPVSVATPEKINWSRYLNRKLQRVDRTN